MRGLGGLALLLAGIGVGLLVYLPAPVDSAASRSANMAAIKFKPISRLGQFSPSIALSGPTPLGPRLAGLEIAAAAVLRAAVVHKAQLGQQTRVSSAVTTGPTELTPRDADARNKLAQEIQQQLRRVGCYWGRIDGSWDSITKDAMREFTHRVNATLPLDLPDYAQLALVQSQSDEVCGACPTGQSLSASGRCVRPIMAQTVASTPKEVLPRMANAVPDSLAAVRLFKPVPTSPGPGRMALGAPVPMSVDVQQDVPPVPLAQTPPLIAALDINVTEVKPQVTALPKAKRRASSSNDGHRRNRRFADAMPSQSARKPQHVRAGTPRYNLLLSLGGVY